MLLPPTSSYNGTLLKQRLLSGLIPRNAARAGIMKTGAAFSAAVGGSSQVALTAAPSRAVEYSHPAKLLVIAIDIGIVNLG